MESIRELIVDQSGERLDRFVSQALPDLSRAAVQRLIEEGHIRVDGHPSKASQRVQIGQAVVVHLPPPEAAVARAEAIPLDVVYEDGDILVVNKPAGMVVHPAAGHPGGTLVNAILAHTPNLTVGGIERPGIVHRLDSDTSGLIVIAKNDAALRHLQAQFKSRQVHKTYLALVDGHINPPRGKIDAPVGRDPLHRQRMAVVTHGKTREAVTIYRTLANVGNYTLLEAEPQTGRTHQIRVHLAFMGFPIVGDSVYGRRTNPLGLDRQFLHAWKLALKLPDGRPASFTAPLPADLRAVLQKLDLNFTYD